MRGFRHEPSVSDGHNPMAEVSPIFSACQRLRKAPFRAKLQPSLSSDVHMGDLKRGDWLRTIKSAALGGLVGLLTGIASGVANLWFAGAGVSERDFTIVFFLAAHGGFVGLVTGQVVAQRDLRHIEESKPVLGRPPDNLVRQLATRPAQASMPCGRRLSNLSSPRSKRREACGDFFCVGL
jgi:hypothetical protein